MAKQSGLGDLLFVDGVDLSGDIGAVQTIGQPSGVLDVTAINASGHERLLGLFDGLLKFSAFFNDETSPAAAHATLKAKSSGANRIASYFHGSAIGNMAASIVGKQINYDWQRGADGSLVADIEVQANGSGLEMGGSGATAVAKDGQLTAGKRTDTGATNGASLDSGIAGGTAKGLAATLHVFSFTGTSITVKIQSSSDDGGGDPYADVTGGAFAAASAVGAQRIVTSLTLAVERYLRVVSTGTFNPCTFAVCHTRYPYA